MASRSEYSVLEILHVFSAFASCKDTAVYLPRTEELICI